MSNLHHIIRYTLIDSPIGRLLLAATERGLCTLTWGEYPEEALAILQTEYPQADLMADASYLQTYIAQLDAYFAGDLTDFDLSLDLQATDFQKLVLAELSRIPYGETRTYAQVAQAIGKPKATRAVGNACGQNPVPIIIPCHRVLHTDSNKSRYGGGVHRKDYLLKLERENELVVAL